MGLSLLFIFLMASLHMKDTAWCFINQYTCVNQLYVIRKWQLYKKDSALLTQTIFSDQNIVWIANQHINLKSFLKKENPLLEICLPASPREAQWTVPI